MAVQQIQLTAADLCRIAQIHIRHTPPEILSRRPLQRKEIPAVFSEIIIHDRVKHIALQPDFRILPDFPDQNRFRTGRAHSIPELAPESLIHFICHIQPPAVHMKLLDPVSSHSCKIILYLRV